tara:strand:+ start:839 stop:1543 length:705 start_codon:yes stop_codon:yes gene_type:complete
MYENHQATNLQRAHYLRANKTNLQDLTDAEREQIDVWAQHAVENPEWAEELRSVGINGPIIDKDFVRGASSDQEAHTYLMESLPAPTTKEEPEQVTSNNDAEAIESKAMVMAGELVRQCLEVMTKSKLPGLRRAADTLVLSISSRASDDSNQASLARRYGVTRALISKDMSHIRAHGSFGVITDKLYADPTKRKQASKRATKVHAQHKEKITTPPEGSLSALLSNNLETLNKTK